MDFKIYPKKCSFILQMVTSVLQTSMCVISSAQKHLIEFSSGSHRYKFCIGWSAAWIKPLFGLSNTSKYLSFCCQFLLRYTPEIQTLFTGHLPFCPFHIKSSVIYVSLKYFHFLKLNFTLWCDYVEPFAMNKIVIFKVKMAYMNLLIASGLVFVLVKE